MVKVDIEEVEETWGDERHEVVVTDSHGIVFMSSRPEWLFRTTRPLTPEDLEALDREKRYSKTELLPFPGEITDGPVAGSRLVRLPVGEGTAAADEGAVRSLAMVSRFVPDSHWTVGLLKKSGGCGSLLRYVVFDLRKLRDVGAEEPGSVGIVRRGLA